MLIAVDIILISPLVSFHFDNTHIEKILCLY